MASARTVPVPLARTSTIPALRRAAPVLGWAVLVLAGHLLGERLVAADPLVRIGAPPLVGSFDERVSLALAPALALGAAGVAWAPALAARLRWGALLGGAWLVAAAWAIALAAADGWDALTAPLLTRYEHLAAVDRVGDPGSFLQGFVTALPTYPTHVKGHPPGTVLVLWALDRAGLGGVEAATAAVIAAGALAAPAALVALRALATEAAARRAAPFVTLTPAAVWLATSTDAIYAGAGACGIAAFALATRPGARRPTALAVGAGLLFGAGLHLSYGLVPLGAVVLVVAAYRRAGTALVAAGAGVVAVALASGAAGFWWWDGLQATRALYDGGVAARRPYAEFLVVALAAFALAVGPAAVAGLARLRGAGAWALSGGALAAVAAADLSGLSRGETERIWLPFAPWLLIAAAALGASRRWLAAQVALAIALQAGVRSPW